MTTSVATLRAKFENGPGGGAEALRTAGLDAAGMRGSKNHLLRELVGHVELYNRISRNLPANLALRVDALHRVMVCAGEYLTCKPPKDYGKSKLRWDALAALARDAALQASAMKIRMVRGPADMRNVGSGKNESYWLEVVDKHHRHGGFLSDSYKEWLNDADSKHSRVSFWIFLGDQVLTDARVKYNQGEKHLVHFSGPHLTNDEDDLVDTTLWEGAAASGDGWGMFVFSTDYKLYLRSQKVGKCHHTTLLGGKPVLAAGEMHVMKGVIRGLTAATGHYHTQPAQMRNLLKFLPGIPDTTVIRPDMRDLEKFNAKRYFTCGEYRQLGEVAKPLTMERVYELLPCLKPIVEINGREETPKEEAPSDPDAGYKGLAK